MIVGGCTNISLPTSCLCGHHVSGAACTGTGDPEGREGHVSCSRPAMEDSPEEQIRSGQLERQKGLARLGESFSKHWCLWDDKE